MFNFFCNLFLSFFAGSWTNNTNEQIFSAAKTTIDSLPIWNMFNHSVNVVSSVNLNGVSSIIAIVLGFITCVALYMLVVKAIKAMCGVFVGWFR